MSTTAQDQQPSYTPEQEQAITARGVSIALAAGAGCGKTFVLTERFLAALAPTTAADPSERLGSLIAITFTDAAARELRTRIRDLVYRKIVAAPVDERDYWLRLQRNIDSCRVSTIHSLCGNLLRSHAFDLGLDPLFAILDQSAAAVLEAEACEDTLRTLLAARDPDTMAIAEAWGIDQAKKNISGLIRHHRDPDFQQWLVREPAEAVAAWETLYRQEIVPAILTDLAPLAEELLRVLGQFAPDSPEAADVKQELALALQSVMRREASDDDLETIVELARTKKRNRPVPFTKKNWGDDALFEEFRDAAKAVRDAIGEQPTPDFSDSELGEAAELGIRLARVTQRVAERYTQVKNQRDAVDYDDLLALAHRLLTDPAHANVQQELREEVDLLLVDEFQDTDRLQVDIVRALVGSVAESGKLFFVGDEKQSIYRFRGAEPQVFVHLREQIAPEWRLPLSRNFRSQPAILRFVNTLFRRTFADGYQALSAHRPQQTPEPAIEFLFSEVEQQGKEAGWEAKAREVEAGRIAARLQELLNGDMPLVPDETHPDGIRPARPGDVAILFRALGDVAIYEQALRTVGIDYYLVGGHAFYTQQEVYDVLHLLRAVASECDELSLAGVLRSPFFSLADETIFCLASRHKSLAAGLFADRLPSELANEEREKVSAAASTLTYLRELKDQATAAELLAAALERTGYDAALLADFMGERKLANLYKLIEQARTAAANGVGTLEDFVTQLAEFTTATPKEALASTCPETANVVRLMTVHQAKGLEFPIVVVADLNRKPSSNRDSVAFTSELGPLVGRPDGNMKETSGLRLFKFMENRHELAESDRLFYVACTRAADYLILSSAVEQLDTPRGEWLKRLAETFDLATGTLLDPDFAVDGRPPHVHVPANDAPAAPSRPERRGVNWSKVLQDAARRPNTDEFDERSVLPVPRAQRRRYSVTRLSGQIIPSGSEWREDEPEEPIGVSAVDDQVDPLGFGTLVHAVLERIDFGDPSTVATWCQVLAPQHDPLHLATASSEAQGVVEKFLHSPRATDMRAARQLQRELEFVMTWPLGSEHSASLYLQGYLDCLYQTDDGRWRVLDYKTNRISGTNVEQVAARYELQMLVYGLAVEQALGVGPAELVLHFLRTGDEVVFEWNARTRQRAIDQVERALSALRS